MSWSSPRTWTVGETLTAANMNTYVSDNLAYLYGPRYRKTTAKTVNTTTTETDLLNSEMTIAAGVIGASGRVRFSACGDWKQNSGGASGPPRFKLKLGGSTLIDTSAGNTTGVANSATRFPWTVEASIFNLGATNSQWVSFWVRCGMPQTPTTSFNAFTTGEGWYFSIADVGGANAFAYDGHGGNSGSVDTTASAALVLSVTNPSASASYEVVLKNALAIIE